jgi:hypothetical protein
VTTNRTVEAQVERLTGQKEASQPLLTLRVAEDI